MGEFRRSRSKVWWSNYYQEDDDADEAKMSSLTPRSTVRFSWRSLPIENSNRNSSSSPSNGSQKSQDSGFSDSESSSPSSCSSKDIKNGSGQTEFKKQEAECTEQTVDSEQVVEPSTAEIKTISKLPETPINRIPRPCLIRRKKREAKIAEKADQSLESDKSKCDTISSYLADCYFPITNVVKVDDAARASELPHSYKSPLSPEDQRYLETVLNESRTLRKHQSSANESNSNEIESRTCFIVDELPKENVKDVTSFQCKDNKSSGSSLETTTSTSDEYKVDDTVRYVEKMDCIPVNAQNCVEVKNVELPCINVDLLKSSDSNESRFSNLDLSHLPEPTHTSTPKKEDVKLPRRIHKRCRRPTSVVNKEETDKPIDAPVLRWLGELKLRYEPECMTTLQAKSVMQYCKRTSVMMISESTSSVQTFQNKTKLIANEFLKFYENLNSNDFNHTELYLRNLINSIMEFIINYSQLLPRMETTGKENLLKLMDMCDRLRLVVCPYNTDKPSLLNDTNILEKFFSRFVDSVLIQQIMLLTAVLETPNSDSTLLNALSGLATLSLNTSRTCELITHFNGIQNLLTISVQSNNASVRKAALRALAIVCQNASTIRKFENTGGIEILSVLLSDVTRTEAELLEIISVLVQITAPWIEDDHIIKGLIYHLHPTINALTRLIDRTNSCETLLLSAAALANISFIEPQAVFILLELDTAGCLLTAVRKLGVRASIFLQEQVATLIANMAAVPETRSHLAQHRAVGALLCFLQVKHSPVQTAAEIAAAERLQHKSAVALSRLCTNTEISKQVVELQGVNRLVRLCREERERNYSDGVLVACLASLRKITANCGNDSVNKLNAKELVEPRLVDSFLLYSSRQESYV